MAWRGEWMSRRGGDGGERYKNTARRRRRRGGRNGRKGKEARKEGGTRVPNGSSAGGCARVGASETKERDRWCPLLSLGVLRFYRASAVPGRDVSAPARHHQSTTHTGPAVNRPRRGGPSDCDRQQGPGWFGRCFGRFWAFRCRGHTAWAPMVSLAVQCSSGPSRREIVHVGTCVILHCPRRGRLCSSGGAAHSRTGSFCLFSRYMHVCENKHHKELTVPKQAPSPVWTREPVNHACCVVTVICVLGEQNKAGEGRRVRAPTLL